MADNFNLRAFLTENKLTKNAQLLKEEATNEANYSDSYDTPAAKAVNAKAGQIVGSIRGYSTALQTIQDAIKQVEQEVGSEATRSEKSTLEKHLLWMFRREMEMEREGVENDEPVMEEDAMEEASSEDMAYTEKVDEVLAESKLTAKERRLVEMVQNALGIAPQAVAEEAPMAEDEMVQENPLPKYKNIDELMSSIEHGTNEAAHKYKMERMKEVAEALEAKVTSLEEGENAEHIDQKAVKQMRKDILALRKAEEKLRKEFDKKFAAKKEKKEEALQEGTFGLKETTETRTVIELGDFQGTLGELQSIVSNLIQEYGESAILTADAGHNNVEFILTV